MSNTTYSIKYDSNSFFSSNPNVDITFPFDVSDVVEWAKKYDETLNTDNRDLFDEKLSNVIISNKDAFINDFLYNNAYFNSDFDPFLLSSESEIPTTEVTPLSEITVNNLPFKGTQIISRNGSTSYVIGKPGVQRVNFQPSCTLNHLHFPGKDGCSIQEITNANGTYYKCLCSGTPVFNSEPHAHCSEFTNNVQNPRTAYYTSYSSTAAVTSMMKKPSQKTNTNTNTNTAPEGSNESGGAADIEYENSEDLQRFNLLIRTIIYEYYTAVNQNVEYRDAIEKRQKSIDTQELALTDSTVKYKKEYLTAFNLLSGIIIAGGYIYGMNKV
jgi:hypothetical protein